MTIGSVDDGGSEDDDIDIRELMQTTNADDNPPEYVMSGGVGELEGLVSLSINNDHYVMPLDDAEGIAEGLLDAVNDLE
jgi:hypothetical protein